ncbi:trimeric intracellular cation channel family protein [Chishuiella sp.]|uniref:trimeric intracellular cation channel family protein n=1 Tax=Chishuiella sp. TaxID=1969467 RepID=UPI0028AB4400|nr:trimeric intracellular cation channel family protein [Chishuiella sp.]
MEIQYFFELFGTLFFGISGALATDDQTDYDWFAAGFIGFLTSIGGGTVRDILLSVDIMWIKDVNLLYAAGLGVLLAAIFYKPLLSLRRTFMLFDTLGIALFTIVGMEKALHLGINPVIAPVMGMFTAVFGSVIRDTMLNELPILFRKEIYAVACLIGAIVYLILMQFHVERSVNFFVSGGVIVFVRLMAIKYNLSLPKFKRS